MPLPGFPLLQFKAQYTEAWNWSCDLRANERPRKNCIRLHKQTDRLKNKHPDGHGNYMTESAQWGQFSEKNHILIYFKIRTYCRSKIWYEETIFYEFFLKECRRQICINSNSRMNKNIHKISTKKGNAEKYSYMPNFTPPFSHESKKGRLLIFFYICLFITNSKYFLKVSEGYVHNFFVTSVQIFFDSHLYSFVNRPMPKPSHIQNLYMLPKQLKFYTNIICKFLPFSISGLLLPVSPWFSLWVLRISCGGSGL